MSRMSCSIFPLRTLNHRMVRHSRRQLLANAAKQHRVLLDQPLGRSHADARTAARVELIVDAPVLAPSGLNEHGITRLLPTAALSSALRWQNDTK